MAPVANDQQVAAPQFALRFISGKYQGGEFPLRMEREIIIGRSSDLDMVLVEDMVSRKHAKISTQAGQIVIQDLGSTNGTFVNGEKIEEARLKEGDRILIGTSIIKLVAVDATQAQASEAEARSRLEANAARRQSTAAGRPMSGSIEEIPLPDLLQLLSTSQEERRPDGPLERRRRQDLPAQGPDLLRVDQRQLRGQAAEGDLPHAHLADGTFELEPPDEKPGHRGDHRVDRGAAHGGHAPARRDPAPRRRARPARAPRGPDPARRQAPRPRRPTSSTSSSWCSTTGRCRRSSTTPTAATSTATASSSIS